MLRMLILFVFYAIVNPQKNITVRKLHILAQV